MALHLVRCAMVRRRRTCSLRYRALRALSDWTGQTYFQGGMVVIKAAHSYCYNNHLSALLMWGDHMFCATAPA